MINENLLNKEKKALKEKKIEVIKRLENIELYLESDIYKDTNLDEPVELKLYKDWKISKKSNAKFIDNKIIFNSEKHEYIYYNNEELLLQLFNKNAKVEFLVDEIDGLDIELHIIGYKEDNTKEVHEIIKFNTETYIEIKQGLRISLALRLKGIGSCNINKLIVSNHELWIDNQLEYILYRNIKSKEDGKEVYNSGKIDVNKHKNITYIPSIKIYKSYLKEKNYEYIKIFNKNINVLDETFFNIKLDVIKDNKVKIDGIIKISYKNGKFEYVQLKNKDDIVLVNDKVSQIEGYVRIQNTGIFKSISFNIEEHDYAPTKTLELDLEKNNWLNVFKKQINLKYQHNSLFIDAHINEGKAKYLSYLEDNNSFSLGPKNIILPIDDKMIYKIEPRITTDEKLNVHLMAVFYNSNEKLSVNQLINNSVNIIQPPRGSNSIRLALRVNGNGKACITNITIQEFEKIKYNNLLEIIDKSELNYLNIQKPKYIKNFNMAVIMDEFTTSSYENECNLIKLSPNSWKKELIQNDVDLLFVESAWNGNGGIWFKKVGDYGYENNKELFDIIEWCNLNNIPTVFWNKEDPVHFERFINTAKRFDLILTTDSNSISDYKKYAGDKIIDVLLFAAQPAKNNPIKLYKEKINKACFAGSYYKLHEERAKDTKIILDEVIEFGLDIYDRNYEAVKKGTMPNHVFPDRFKPYIKGSLKYNEIDKAYKGYKLVVNLNTVKNSPTMFARRVYEVLACGTPVISNYSQGIKNIFKDLVYIVENKGEMKDTIQKLMNDDTYYAKSQMNGMREVFEKHTYNHRFKFILDKLGLKYTDSQSEITLLAVVKSKKEFEQILNIYKKQNYKQKKLVILISKFDGYIDIFKKYNIEDINVYIKSYMHNYNNISGFIKSNFFGFISHNKFYGENYLRDLSHAIKYTNADIIGKSAYYHIENNSLNLKNAENEYIFTENINIFSAISKPNVFDYDDIDKIINNIESINIDEYAKRGKRVFSTDKYNYIDNYNENTDKNIIKMIEI